MRSWLRVTLSTMLLVGATLAAARWLTHLGEATRNYRTPLRAMPLTRRGAPPLTEHLVVVVRNALPGYARQAAWTTLLTGASPEINDAILLADRPDAIGALTVDDLLSAARRVGLTTRVVGHAGWERLLGGGDHAVWVTDTESAEGDAAIVVEVLRVLKGDSPPNLLWVQLETGDGLHVEAIADAVDLENATLAVIEISDDSASKETESTFERVILEWLALLGERNEALAEDLITLRLGGRGIQSTNLGVMGLSSLAQARDVAPTLAALIGAPMPGIAQGDVLYGALDLTPEAGAERRTMAASQRAALAGAYIEGIGGEPLPSTVGRDIQVAWESLAVGHPRSADQLARFALRDAREAMAAARTSRLMRERVNRAMLALVLLALPLWALGGEHGARRRAQLLCALLALIAERGILGAAGDVSTLAGLADGVALWRLHLWLDALGRLWLPVASSAALATVLLCALDRRSQTKYRLLRETWAGLAGYGLWLCYLLAAPVAVAFASHGLAPTWHLPQTGSIAMQARSLARVSAVGLSGAILPLMIVIIGSLLRGSYRLGARITTSIKRRTEHKGHTEASHAHRDHR